MLRPLDKFPVSAYNIDRTNTYKVFQAREHGVSITMEELAALANVSQGAVSLVLNGKAQGQISKAKQEKILALAEKYRYRVNMAAKSLRNKRQYAVGVIMPCHVNFFYATMVALLQMKLAERGYMALFSFWQSKDDVEKAYDSVYERKVDGIISWDVCERMLQERIPTVFYNREIEGYDGVRYDFARAYRGLFEYLWSLGHRRIGYAGVAGDLRQGYLKKFLQEHGVRLRKEWSFDLLDFMESGNTVVECFLAMKEHPTALITTNDETARGVILAGIRRGMRLPEELSVVGFMNLPEAKMMTPALTTFDSRNELLADCLVNRILRRIEKPDLPPEQSLILPELILRDSCCAAGGEGI